MDYATWALAAVTLLGMLLLPGFVSLVRIWSNVQLLETRVAEYGSIRDVVMEIRDRLARIEALFWEGKR